MIPSVASFVMFSYSGSKLGVNAEEALVLQQALHANHASLLASQVMRASETTGPDYVIELDDEGARQLRDAINRVEKPWDAFKNLRQLVS
jgi:hypothetical protein